MERDGEMKEGEPRCHKHPAEFCVCLYQHQATEGLSNNNNRTMLIHCLG